MEFVKACPEQKIVETYVDETEIITLRDGRLLTIRAIRGDDAPRLQELFFRLSPDSVHMRFLGFRKSLPEREAKRLASLDYQTGMALVATDENCGGQNIIAVARYFALDQPDIAEAAVVVEDAYQNQGLGTLLMKRLVTYAWRHGVRIFKFMLYSRNERMWRLIQHCGPVLTSHQVNGILQVQTMLEVNDG